jgi:hypothetical protein
MGGARLRISVDITSAVVVAALAVAVVAASVVLQLSSFEPP